MADIVLAIGTSHSPLLNSPAEDYPKHAAIDASGRKLLDKQGPPLHLWRAAGERPTLPSRNRSRRKCSSSGPRTAPRISRSLSRVLADARLDALIIIGDDQHEQFFDDNMPAILIYWGDKIAEQPAAHGRGRAAILAQGALAIP